MKSREDFLKVRYVIFGRGRGAQTHGEIHKLNPTKAQVRITERRNSHPAGTIFNVPYNMLRPADAAGNELKEEPKPLPYSPFRHLENLILEAILAVYSDLSPENLSGDGELPQALVRRRYAELQATLGHLQKALGRSVTEEQVYKWDEERRRFEANQKAANLAAG